MMGWGRLRGVLFLLSSLASSAWADPVSFPSPADLGFSSHGYRDREGNRILELRSSQTGRFLKSTYSPTGELLEMSEYLHSGRLVDRRTMVQGTLVHETFEPAHEIRTVRQLDGDSAVSQVEWVRFTAGKPVLSRFQNSSEDALRCDPPSPPPNAQALLSNLSWLNLQAGTASGEVVQLGANLEAHGCRGYQRGGNDGLARDIGQGLREGLACMKQLGPAREMDAARITAFLQQGYGRRARIVCGTPGQNVSVPGAGVVRVDGGAMAAALDCTTPSFPAMSININTIPANHDPVDARATFFHEMLHWLGYRHGEGMDVTYLVEMACFSNGSEMGELKKNLARQILSENSSWTSPGYQRDFYTLMAINGRPGVALRSGWASAWSAPLRGTPPRRDAGALFAQMIRMGSRDPEPNPSAWREEGLPFFALIMARGAAENVHGSSNEAVNAYFGEKLRDRYYPRTDASLAPKRELANWVGMYVNDILNGNAGHIVNTRAQFDELAARTCPLLSGHEKAQLREALSLTSLSVLQNHDVDATFRLRWSHGDICPP